MTIFDMLEQSGVLTLLGMGVVFGFLVIMIICVSIMGRIIQALGGDKEKAAPKPKEAAKTTAVAAAITAAITEYRNETNQ